MAPKKKCLAGNLSLQHQVDEPCLANDCPHSFLTAFLRHGWGGGLFPTVFSTFIAGCVHVCDISPTGGAYDVILHESPYTGADVHTKKES